MLRSAGVPACSQQRYRYEFRRHGLPDIASSRTVERVRMMPEPQRLPWYMSPVIYILPGALELPAAAGVLCTLDDAMRR